MDCFYAAIEVRDRPHLKGRPVAVGGNPNGRGVIATANYEARKFGVRSAMSSRAAIKLCPQLEFVYPDFRKYKEASRQIHEVFKKYSALIEPLSLDEAFLDVSECELFDGLATEIARQIRADVFEKTQLTCSAGIAPNKFLAKVASEWKKPNGQFTVAPPQVEDFVKQLSVKRIPGVGKVTAAKMEKLGLKTCEDIQRWSLQELEARFGTWGHSLYFLSRGEDNRPVSTSRVRKSLSVENTYSEDIRDFDSSQKQLKKLYEEFQRRLEKSNVENERIKSAFVKLKFHDFQQSTHETQVSGVPVFEQFLELAQSCWARENKPVRLMGLGVRLKSSSKPRRNKSQLSLF